MYRVKLNPHVLKKFDKFPSDLKSRIAKAIEILKENPYIGRRLSGELKGSYRLRVGAFRIIYDIDKEEQTIVIHAIGSRGDIYK